MAAMHGEHMDDTMDGMMANLDDKTGMLLIKHLSTR